MSFPIPPSAQIHIPKGRASRFYPLGRYLPRMSHTLFGLCGPRKSVFDPSRRETLLDLTDLLDAKINPKEFFSENHLTDGLKQLLRHGLRRLAGRSDQGVFILSQSMGGGKTPPC